MDRIAKPYAKALFGLTKPEDLKAMKSLLTSFAELFDASADLKNTLLSPMYLVKEREEALAELAHKVSGGNASFGGLLRTLLRNKRLESLSNIAEAFSQMVDQYEKLTALTVVTAFPMGTDEQKAMVGAIREQLGSGIQVTWKVDQSLIGGMRLVAGDLVLDNSIFTALKRIEQQLIQ